MPTPQIFVDADACPVKDEIYKVALRRGTPTVVVTNSFLRIPNHPLITRIAVEATPDAADDYIAERADALSLVVTSDIPLADRCLKADAMVLSPKGKAFTPDSIGAALATRSILEELRGSGEITGGPPPFQKKDRSAFLSALDTALVRLERKAAGR